MKLLIKISEKGLGYDNERIDVVNERIEKKKKWIKLFMCLHIYIYLFNLYVFMYLR